MFLQIKLSSERALAFCALKIAAIKSDVIRLCLLLGNVPGLLSSRVLFFQNSFNSIFSLAHQFTYEIEHQFCWWLLRWVTSVDMKILWHIICGWIEIKYIHDNNYPTRATVPPVMTMLKYEANTNLSNKPLNLQWIRPQRSKLFALVRFPVTWPDGTVVRRSLVFFAWYMRRLTISQTIVHAFNSALHLYKL